MKRLSESDLVELSESILIKSKFSLRDRSFLSLMIDEIRSLRRVEQAARALMKDEEWAWESLKEAGCKPKPEAIKLQDALSALDREGKP